MDFKRLTRKPLFYVVLAVLGFFVLASAFSAEDRGAQVDTSAVLQALDADQVTRAEINDADQRIEIVREDGTRQHAFFLNDAGDRLIGALDDSGVTYEVVPGGSGLLASLLIGLLPLLLSVLLLFFFLSQMQGGGGRVMQLGKSKAKLVAKDTP